MPLVCPWLPQLPPHPTVRPSLCQQLWWKSEKFDSMSPNLIWIISWSVATCTQTTKVRSQCLAIYIKSHFVHFRIKYLLAVYYFLFACSKQLYVTRHIFRFLIYANWHQNIFSDKIMAQISTQWPGSTNVWVDNQ